MDLLHLQNGSDIRGVAIETDTHERNLTLEAANVIAKGFVHYLLEATKKQSSDLHVSVGTDSRLSGPSLKEAVIEGLTSLGVNVSDAGLASTPAMFMSCVLEEFQTDGAIMITASHMPYFYNGLKFFTRNGGLDKTDIHSILTYSAEESFLQKDPGQVHQVKLVDAYAKTLVQKIQDGTKDKKPLKGMNIVVDAGNGAGGFYASKVLKVLGADVSKSQFLDPDGNFPNHIPNPENKEAMESISNRVKEVNADLGIIFDTDVDRAAIVDGNGNEINKNALIAVISNIVLEENPGSTIVTDSITSTGLTEYIAKLGGMHHRFKRGYKNVINESIRLNSIGEESSLAIETSGHAALKENYFLDDGAYLVSKILIKVANLYKEGKTIDTLLSDFPVPVESTDYRLTIKLDEFAPYGNNIIKELKTFVEQTDGLEAALTNYEGLRVNADKQNGDGWFLVRMSLHEPLLVINLESDSDGGIELMLNHLVPFLKSFESLDISKL